MALASRQSIAEVEGWDDHKLATVLEVLEEHARAREDAARGR